MEKNNEIVHRGTINLETDRLLLRRLTIDDAEDMFNNWASDPEVTKYLTWDHHNSIEITKAILNDWVQKYDNNEFYQWGIMHKEDNSLIGTISIVQKNDFNKEFELGVCIAKKYWGKSIAGEAVNTVIKFMKSLGYEVMISTTKVGNEKCLKAISKNGNQYIGVKESGCTNLDGTKSDIHVFVKKI
ncbi:MAG: GNAT family N-acetyltransferase [Bacilli bacterium]|nr:GNAT family N-acetyltransferase [Bacilli bacterium]